MEVTNYYYALLALLAPLVLVERERLLVLAVYIGLALSGHIFQRQMHEILIYAIYSGFVLGMLLFVLWGEVYSRAAES